MTDNRTTELREKLNKLIIEIERLDIKLDSPAYGITLGEYEQEREKLLDEFMQAISATLGNGTLTAEQVREAVEKHWHDLPDEYDMPEATALPEYSYDWQAIADELNAELGSGTCECVKGKCSNCGKDLPEDPYSDYEGNFCPSCGARIRKAVE